MQLSQNSFIFNKKNRLIFHFLKFNILNELIQTFQQHFFSGILLFQQFYIFVTQSLFYDITCESLIYPIFNHMHSEQQGSYIPKIDVSSLLDGNFDSPIAKEAIKKIDDACRNVGFFSIINHGVKKDLIKETLAKIKEFFYLSPEKKLECAAKKWNPKSTNSYRGYFPSTVHGKQGLDIQDPQMTQVPEKFKDLYFYETNNFSKDVSNDWVDTIKEYYTELHKLSLILTKALFYSFSKGQQWVQFSKGLQRPLNLTTLRFNYYPKHQKDSQPAQISKQDGAHLACETHVDSVIFTVLYQDSQGGLQVKNSKDGKWYTVSFDEDAFVVNTGRTTQVLTNGSYQATWHRVLMNYHERISIPFFFEPAADAVLNPNILVEGEPKYKVENYGQFIKESLKKFKEYDR